MKSLMVNIGLLGLVSVLGCGDQTSPTAPGSELAAAASSDCHSVKFTTLFTAVSDFVYTGTVTGDLQGTADLVADEVHSFHGITLLVGADVTWHITGGIIPELTGETFVTRLTQHNIFLPGTSLVKNIGSLRAISGVERANVTFSGLTILGTDPQQAKIDFVGVICTN
jgi:hypothetical protein